ncbi:MAG: hypothetical protein K5650_04810 [Bacteroidales bacterium]|nr:hypothetical protein [Bacteroidales bacterium]
MDTTQQFDIQWKRFLNNMEQLVTLLESQRQHPVQQALNLMSLCSSYSEFLDALLPYYEAQRASLRLRTAVHRRYKDNFSRLDERLQSLDLSAIEALPATVGRMSRYAHTPFYSEGLYSLTELMRQNAPVVCKAFAKMRAETAAIMQRLADLPRNYDAQRLLKNFEDELEAYKNSSEGQALLLTYRRDTLHRIKPTDVTRLMEELDADYEALPVARLYRKFAGNPLEFCVQVRKGTYSDDDFKYCYEYIAQRELLDAIDSEFSASRSNPGDEAALVDLTDHIFARRIIFNATRAATLRELIGSLFDDGYDGIDTRQKNQLFVLYYVLVQHNMLATTKATAFMEQLERWYPARFEHNRLPLYVRSIYTEQKRWRNADGSMVRPDALFQFLGSPQCTLRQSKADAFRRKIQRAERTILQVLR